MTMIVERVVTVEYLEPSMSRELLGKFPDGAAFDFDYSQSGIWSPLVARDRQASSAATLCKEVQRILKDNSSNKLRKVKKKVIKKHKKGNDATKKLEFSPKASTKGRWNKVLQAATKRFKVQGRSPWQMLLPTL